jgi:hypothetical protein
MRLVHQLFDPSSFTSARLNETSTAWLGRTACLVGVNLKRKRSLHEGFLTPRQLFAQNNSHDRDQHETDKGANRSED